MTYIRFKNKNISRSLQKGSFAEILDLAVKVPFLFSLHRLTYRGVCREKLETCQSVRLSN